MRRSTGKRQEQHRDRPGRRPQECVREGAHCMRLAGIRPARVTVLPPELLALALKLPDAIVMRMARSLVGINPAARSSTLQDLDRGRSTEVSSNGA